MGKIIDAQDILVNARNCVECIFLAASAVGDKRDPIQIVADIASTKIDEAIALLKEYLGGPDAIPLPNTPSAEPVIRVTRTKRKGK
jgi:hypothetical protein